MSQVAKTVHSSLPRQRSGRYPAVLASLGLLLWLLSAPTAFAGAPNHTRLESLDVTGLNHACGAAVDSEGDLYLASAGESKVKVYDPAHNLLTEIANANEPCGLAVNSKGELYVSEETTGRVVRYKPSAYPFAGTPTYGAAETIDSSGNAKGISVDPHDDRLYVAEGDHVAAYEPDGSFAAWNEVQRVDLFEVTGGSFELIFEGEETAPIPFDATAAEIDAALEPLSTIGAGNVDVQIVEGKYLVEFVGALGDDDVAMLDSNGTALIGGSHKQVIVKEWVRGSSGQLGEGTLSEAIGIAVYSYPYLLGQNFKGELDSEHGDTHIFVADAGGADAVNAYVRSFQRREFISGGGLTRTVGPVKLRRTIEGVDHDGDPSTPEQSFGFGPAGTLLAIDPGNSEAEFKPNASGPVLQKCVPVAEQACTAGHLLVYDEAHEAIHELETSGEFLDQLPGPIADGEPTAMAIDRSGGSGDGTIYVTTGASAGAKALAFGPLAAPARAPRPDLSHLLPGAQAVAVDSQGGVYVAAGASIHVFDPTGKEIAVGPAGKGIEDPGNAADLSVDSTGKVYVLDIGNGFESEAKVTYYTPSAYPPAAGTTYSRHEPSLVTAADLGGRPNAIAVNPANDRLFVTNGTFAHEYASASAGSALLDDDFAKGLCGVGTKESIDVYGKTGAVYFGEYSKQVCVVDAAGEEVLASISGAGSGRGELPARPYIDVDQSNGHFVVFEDTFGVAQEYDSSGAFVAEFGNFTSLSRRRQIAIDNACALHDPPLTEATTPTCAEFDPATGNVYVAFDDTAPGSFDLTAFDRLAYGEPPTVVTVGASELGGGEATLNGTVDPNGFPTTECKFEYLSDAEYLVNKGAEEPPFQGATSVACAEDAATIGKGDEAVAVHVEIGGLDPEGRYRFRLVAANKYGADLGDASLFGPPAVTTRPALPVLYDEATLRATVDPSGLATEYSFEYGKAAGEYDHSTPVAIVGAKAGASDVSAVLLGLAEGTTYHFRVLAENEAGAFTGPDQSFRTQARGAPQSCANGEYRTGLSARLADCRAYELVTPAEMNGLTPTTGAPGSPGARFNEWLVTPRGAGAGETVTYFTDGTLPGFEGTGRLDGYQAHRGAGAHPASGWSTTLVGPSLAQTGGSSPSPVGSSADQRFLFWRLGHVSSFEGTLPEGLYLRTPDGSADPACNPVPSQSTYELIGCGAEGTDPLVESDYVSSAGEHVIFSSTAQLEEAAAPAGTRAVYDRRAGEASAAVISVKPDGEPFAAGENAAYVAASEDGAAVVFRVGGTLYLRRAGQTYRIAAAPNTFAGVSADGTRVFYVAAAGGEDPASLFACDVQSGPCVGEAAHAPTAIASDGIFVNVSADGSHAFFSSEEVLSGSEENEAGQSAEAGQPNLYAWNEMGTRFVAVLDPHDFDLGSFEGHPGMSLAAWTQAINPGAGIGRALAPTRGTPDGGILVFQSHAQIGAFDNGGVGEIYRYAPGAPEGERLLCVSCDPSGAPPSADALLQDVNFGGGTTEETLIPNLSDDGARVVFQSANPLSPEDANQVVDVYEWEGGVPLLISSGQGQSPSHLYGMSADGDDVFFRTVEELVAADVRGSASLYDARVGGGIPEATAAAPCQGDSCQGPGTPPPALPDPKSTSSAGERRAKPKPCPKAKRRVRGRCVKAHRAKKHRKARHRRGRASR